MPPYVNGWTYTCVWTKSVVDTAFMDGGVLRKTHWAAWRTSSTLLYLIFLDRRPLARSFKGKGEQQSKFLPFQWKRKALLLSYIETHREQSYIFVFIAQSRTNFLWLSRNDAGVCAPMQWRKRASSIVTYNESPLYVSMVQLTMTISRAKFQQMGVRNPLVTRLVQCGNLVQNSTALLLWKFLFRTKRISYGCT